MFSHHKSNDKSKSIILVLKSMASPHNFPYEAKGMETIVSFLSEPAVLVLGDVLQFVRSSFDSTTPLPSPDKARHVAEILDTFSSSKGLGRDVCSAAIDLFCRDKDVARYELLSTFIDSRRIIELSPPFTSDSKGHAKWALNQLALECRRADSNPQELALMSQHVGAFLDLDSPDRVARVLQAECCIPLLEEVRIELGDLATKPGFGVFSQRLGQVLENVVALER